MEISRLIAQKVTEKREEMNMTKAELSARSGVSRRHIDNIEAGMSTTTRILEKVLYVLDIDIILDDKNEEDKEDWGELKW